MNNKIIFFGTPDFSAGILRGLLESGYEIPAVFTQPDKRIGRKQEIVFSPVKQAAQKHGIKILQPENVRDAGIAEGIRDLSPDLVVVAAYGKILPKTILDLPRFGCLNVHASLLPKFRGASPVQNAILSGEKETGVTLMLMNEKMDEGDILAQDKVEIGQNDMAESLLRKLEKSGSRLVIETIPLWTGGKIKPVPQNGAKATYCYPIRREDGRINWAQKAQNIFQRWKAFYPWPGIYSIISTGKETKKLKLIEIKKADFRSEEKFSPGEIFLRDGKVAVAASEGAVFLEKIQLEGKKEMGAEEFVRGCPAFIGSILDKQK